MELLGCSLLWSSWAGGMEERMWWDPSWSKLIVFRGGQDGYLLGSVVYGPFVNRLIPSFLPKLGTP